MDGPAPSVTQSSVSATKKDKTSMFHIDATFELTRIVAESGDGKQWTMVINENLKGSRSGIIPVTHEQLAAVLAINLHPDGEPSLPDGMGEVLETLFAGLTPELRPIP